jgi:hypothetical protein
MMFGLEKQSRRRAAVMAIYFVGAAQMFFLYGLQEDWFPKWGAILGLAAAALLFAGSVALLNRLTKDYGMESDRVGDERQRRVRDSAFRTAYQWFTVMVFLFGIYVDLSLSRKLAGKIWSPTEGDNWRLVTWALVYVGVTLPQAILAWREPDPPAEESFGGYAAPMV